MALYSERRPVVNLQLSRPLNLFTCLGTPSAHERQGLAPLRTYPWKHQQWMAKGPEIQLSMADMKQEKPKTPKATVRKSSHFAHSTVQSELYSFIS